MLMTSSGTGLHFGSCAATIVCLPQLPAHQRLEREADARAAALLKQAAAAAAAHQRTRQLAQREMGQFQHQLNNSSAGETACGKAALPSASCSTRLTNTAVTPAPLHMVAPPNQAPRLQVVGCKWALPAPPGLLDGLKTLPPPVTLVQGVVMHEPARASRKRRLSPSPADLAAEASARRRATSPWAECARQPTTPDMVNPHEFLIATLAARGYPTQTVVALESRYATKPTAKQVKDYSIDLVNAVRAGDLDTLREMHAAGCSMNACNKFAESVVHMAARIGAREVMEFMIECTGVESLAISDDYGR
eukprot:TRINITY_DN524_c0_g1_i1.p1 TRINITY_DN524_c0_g1~~TRINITY_DN524_c0_g1_i1.p1  ORF type:complete len:306 (-),score=49.94 TRINITY_DN524_c0_g1_i1:983-1900(-)